MIFKEIPPFHLRVTFTPTRRLNFEKCSMEVSPLEIKLAYPFDFSYYLREEIY